MHDILIIAYIKVVIYSPIGPNNSPYYIASDDICLYWNYGAIFPGPILSFTVSLYTFTISLYASLSL